MLATRTAASSRPCCIAARPCRFLPQGCGRIAPVTPTRRPAPLHAAAQPRPLSEPSIQLGTAAVPSKVQVPLFLNSLYQWAATLTQSGSNYPTALPLKVDKLDCGFRISLLKRAPGPSTAFASAGDIQVTLEEVDPSKNVLFIRFYEGPVSLVDRKTPPPADPEERLEAILAGLVDVTTIMQTMPNAIMAAVKTAQ